MNVAWKLGYVNGLCYTLLSHNLQYNVKGFVGEREGDSEVLVMEERGRQIVRCW